MTQSFYELYFHLIWSTKYRAELIDDEIALLVKQKIMEKAQQLKARLIEFNSYMDHCHLLSTIPPKLSISEFAGQIKGYSSHEINKSKGSIRLEWQRGFGVVSLSRKGIPFIIRYIQNQKQHHENNNLVGILERSTEE